MRRSVAATPAERARPMPGDHLVAGAIPSHTYAITVAASPAEVWGWIAQMGAGSRAGWYAYDLLDNASQPSATRIVTELQALQVGMIFPALPGATDGFVLVTFEAPRYLVLGWLAPHGSWLVSRAFVLDPRPDGSTRLVVRARGGREPSFNTLPRWAAACFAPVVHFLMQRKQLLGIAARAEAAARRAR